MNRYLFNGIILMLILFLSACDVFSLDVGGEGQPCADNGTCRPGFVCNELDICVRPTQNPCEALCYDSEFDLCLGDQLCLCPEEELIDCQVHCILEGKFSSSSGCRRGGDDSVGLSANDAYCHCMDKIADGDEEISEEEEVLPPADGDEEVSEEEEELPPVDGDDEVSEEEEELPPADGDEEMSEEEEALPPADGDEEMELDEDIVEEEASPVCGYEDMPCCEEGSPCFGNRACDATLQRCYSVVSCTFTCNDDTHYIPHVMWGDRCGLDSYRSVRGSILENTLDVEINLHDYCCWGGDTPEENFAHLRFNCTERDGVAIDSERLLDVIEIDCTPEHFNAFIAGVNPVLVDAIGGGQIGSYQFDTLCTDWTGTGENGIPNQEWCYQEDSAHCESSLMCEGGACCNLSDNTFLDATHVCDEAALAEYACPDGVGCGDDVKVRYKKRYCSGSSAQCDGALSNFGAWELHDDCGALEFCLENDEGAVCEPNHIMCRDDYCDSGVCCDVDGFTLYNDNEICADEIESGELRCSSSGCGGDVEEKIQRRYCDGLSNDCLGRVVDVEWRMKTDCATNQLCSPTTFRCEAAEAQYEIRCDSLTRYYYNECGERGAFIENCDDEDPCTTDTCTSQGCGHSPLTNDCGERTCGSAPSGCFDCGSCGEDYVCNDGTCECNAP